MITLKLMRWSNVFSYGPDNEIVFDRFPLTQLHGKNGHGKSSIALILEEVLYNKNSKGIKKADILNRYASSKSYSISIYFTKDADNYEVHVKRASSLSVQLIHNSIDISAHTAPSTFKLLEEILGMDHKTFTQLIYQSSAHSLEFLTATDSKRKEFLVELFDLSVYSRTLELLKKATKDIDSGNSKITGTISAITKVLASNEKVDKTIVEEIPEPAPPTEIQDQTAVLRHKLAGITETNKRISANNKYGEILEGMELSTLPDESPEKVEPINEKIASAKAELRLVENTVTHLSKLNAVCPTCNQSVDLDSVKAIIAAKSSEAEKLQARIKSLLAELEAVNKKHAAYAKIVAQHADFEKYHSLFNPSMERVLLNAKDIEQTIAANEASIALLTKQIKAAQEHNSKARAHNTKVQHIMAQNEELLVELEEARAEQAIYSAQLADLTTLIKAFGPTGIVAYKLECMVKDLELSTNEYLADISDGRFQLSFKLDQDKLNVVITDNGIDIDIAALSNGEGSRVNVATLLGIRKLMQSMTSSKVNLLILDETIESLDSEGKDKLAEILLAEEDLNTFLVSHGYTHPMLEKVTAIKTGNISRLEHG